MTISEPYDNVGEEHDADLMLLQQRLNSPEMLDRLSTLPKKVPCLFLLLDDLDKPQKD